MANITYYLGAGASYQACPILSELGEKMMSLYAKYDPTSFDESQDHPDYKELRDLSIDNPVRDLLYNIGYFGQKAKEFGTIDTYARKLMLNNKDEELNRLKLYLSVFFSIWEQTNDEKIKRFRPRSIPKSRDRDLDTLIEAITGQRKIVRPGESFPLIDQRYISLLSTLLKKDPVGPRLKNTVNFISWNYDLQIERTLHMFQDNVGWESFEHSGGFRPDLNENSLRICHLNGYHGYYNDGYDDKKKPLIKSFFKNNYYETLALSAGNIADIFKDKESSIDASDHIGYSDDPQCSSSQIVIERASEILNSTHKLIIIGYSFPSFNKPVDAKLFGALNKKAKIVYQDPNASYEPLTNLLQGKILEKDIKLLNKPEEMYQFHVPYEF